MDIHNRLDSRRAAQNNTIQEDGTHELVQNIFQLVRAGETAWLARLLQIGLTPNLSDNNDNTLLMLAIDYGHLTTAQLLLDSGADANAVTPDGQTPLALATRYKQVDMIELLRSYGAQTTLQRRYVG